MTMEKMDTITAGEAEDLAATAARQLVVELNKLNPELIGADSAEAAELSSVFRLIFIRALARRPC